MLADVAEAAARTGLALRGALHPEDTGSPRAATIALLGFEGRGGWPAFAASPEYADNRPDPLDRWSRRVVERLAETFGAEALFPFDGPPWHPFQAWAMLAGAAHPSPLGLLIHPGLGLWHSYRGALAFPERLRLPERPDTTAPCPTCTAEPCLTACPVEAFTPGRYDVAACRTHLGTPTGAACRDGGCRARLSCPVGAAHAYGAEQTTFLMDAFAGGG